MINNKRPINLDLLTIRFPITAITSILHRISGILLFIGVPILLYLFDKSLKSPEDFMQIKNQLQEPMLRFIVWGIWSAFTYHLLAGVRHIIMDFGFAESKETGRFTSILILIITIVLISLEALWLWGVI